MRFDPDHCVFYDVDDGQKIVSVRAVRRKPGGRKTEEIL
jgi:hypothetical protein